MLSQIANILGYLLNFLYKLVNNYGIAIICFTVLIKAVMLPLTIKQQKSMKKNSKMQEELKAIQFKYKNNPEQLNKETMELYKREGVSPFSGCLGSILQIILLLSVFYLVSRPLTYMVKINNDQLETYKEQYVSANARYPEIEIIKNSGEDENENIHINMNFLGLDLSSVPLQEKTNPKVYIIPVIYVISSIVSMKITLNAQEKMLNKKENKEEKEGKEEDSLESMNQMNKSMSYMMPIMAVSISLVAPLGLGLYWLINNLLMIGERIITDKFILKEEE